MSATWGGLPVTIALATSQTLLRALPRSLLTAVQLCELHPEGAAQYARESKAAGEPLMPSVVQAWPSSQLVGQLPSHFSGDSVTPLPHTGEHVLSLLALQPLGQH